MSRLVCPVRRYREPYKSHALSNNRFNVFQSVLPVYLDSNKSSSTNHCHHDSSDSEQDMSSLDFTESTSAFCTTTQRLPALQTHCSKRFPSPLSLPPPFSSSRTPQPCPPSAVQGTVPCYAVACNMEFNPSRFCVFCCNFRTQNCT